MRKNELVETLILAIGIIALGIVVFNNVYMLIDIIWNSMWLIIAVVVSIFTSAVYALITYKQSKLI